jgi:hypothetical protein
VNRKNGYAQSKIHYNAAESAEIRNDIALGVLIGHNLGDDSNHHGYRQEKPIRTHFGFWHGKRPPFFRIMPIKCRVKYFQRTIPL